MKSTASWLPSSSRGDRPILILDPPTSPPLKLSNPRAAMPTKAKARIHAVRFMVQPQEARPDRHCGSASESGEQLKEPAQHGNTLQGDVPACKTCEAHEDTEQGRHQRHGIKP